MKNTEIKTEPIVNAPEALETELQHAPDLQPYLLPSESIVSVRSLELRAPDRPLSSLKEMLALTRTVNSADIGHNGPSFASKPVYEQDAPKELMLYQTVFGRDSLRVALDLIGKYPQLTRSTLVTLAEAQGVDYDTPREEEPGRIAHEIRDPSSDIAQELTQERGWGWPYYGAVDATPEYIRAFCSYIHNPERRASLLGQSYTDRHGNEQPMLHSFENAVDWVTSRLDENPEGLLEYKPAFPGSLENQVWKDSWDSYFHKDGTIANHQKGIGSIEVQRLAYDALIDTVELYEELGRSDDAAILHERADWLRYQIFDKFWTDEKGGYFVIGTDRDDEDRLRQLQIRTSNMGHLLHSRLLKGSNPDVVEMREAVIAQLFSPELLNVSGIRTLATDEVRFKPGAYHNGSVWLWDSSFIAKGLRYHGYNDLAQDIEKRILNVANHTRLLPEFVRGDNGDKPSVNNRIVDVWDSQYERTNRIEQPPQEIQAWTVASVLSIKSKLKQNSRANNNLHEKFQAKILGQIKS